ncbi:MAG: hypothetical protein DRJ44_02510 [Thermoprotei archaeon]|nr:MAG: hypothetical protein DRJ44_02510 [Thermoprotei archaeon]
MFSHSAAPQPPIKFEDIKAIVYLNEECDRFYEYTNELVQFYMKSELPICARLKDLFYLTVYNLAYISPLVIILSLSSNRRILGRISRMRTRRIVKIAEIFSH